MSAPGFTRGQVLAVFRGDETYCAYGEVEWVDRQGQWLGAPLVAPFETPDMPDMEFKIKLAPGRLSEPTFIVLLGGVLLQRIDVNGLHKGKRFTHLQRASPDNPSDTTDTTDLSDTFPEIPVGRTITDEHLQVAYRAAAERFRIDTHGTTWVSPPLEGVTR